MYVNYKNLLRKELVLQPETMEEYERIKRLGTVFQTKANLKNFYESIPITVKQQYEQAKILIKNKSYIYYNVDFCIDTLTKKWLLLTGVTFPDEEAFLRTLARYGITYENVRNLVNKYNPFKGVFMK